MGSLILHPLFQEPREKLKQALEQPSSGRFVFVVGPSRAGKTTMRFLALRELYGDPSKWGRGNIPVIQVNAVLAEKAYFSSKSLVEMLIDQFFTPDLAWLCASDAPTAAVEKIFKEITEAKSIWDGTHGTKDSERKKWNRFIDLAAARSTRLVCIDQAALLCTNHRDTKPADHILHLMSLIEHKPINVLLSGVHEAAALWNTRPEIRGRSKIIWARPYDERRKEDRDTFLRVLENLGRKFPTDKPRLLRDMAAELMATSAGVFGVLLEVLGDALSRASAEGRNAITRRDIEASYYDNRSLQTLYREVDEFREAMKSDGVDERAARVTKRWQLPGSSA